MVNLGQAAVGSAPGRPARPEGYTTLRALDAMLQVFGGVWVATCMAFLSYVAVHCGVQVHVCMHCCIQLF